MNTQPITRSKSSYKVRNWKDYNASLCKRGSLSLWLDKSLFWKWKRLINKRKEVGEVTYPVEIIQCCLLVKFNYGLRFRQCTGFLRSLFELVGNPGLPVPDYSTLCRRQSALPVGIGQRLMEGENLFVGIDSTGLKVYGEGEWKVRKHGWNKHRTWRKLHIGIDLETQEILSVELTGNDEDDAPVGRRMLEGQTGRIGKFAGDGAYDAFGFREILDRKTEQTIPPTKNAVVRKAKKGKPLPGYLKQRNEAVEYINKHGLKAWKQEKGYHKRSLNETVMYRFKTIFGDKLDARLIKNQQVEAKLKCQILNRFTGIGMPGSYKVA